jgi:hypothetical protein
MGVSQLWNISRQRYERCKQYSGRWASGLHRLWRGGKTCAGIVPIGHLSTKQEVFFVRRGIPSLSKGWEDVKNAKLAL